MPLWHGIATRSRPVFVRLVISGIAISGNVTCEVKRSTVRRPALISLPTPFFRWHDDAGRRARIGFKLTFGPAG